MRSTHWKRGFSFIGIATLAILLGLNGRHAAAQTGNGLAGVIRLSDRSLCYYNNPFFGKRVFPLIEYTDIHNNSSSSAASQLGLYEVPFTTNIGDRIRVTCEGLVVEHTLDQADIDSERFDIVLANRRPLVAPLVARLGGQAVKGVPAGATVTISLAASDPDSDPLHYSWGATNGTATNINAPQATWTLPNSRGLHFLYVLVSDGRGGYVEQQLALSTDGGVVPLFSTFIPLSRVAGQPAALAQPLLSTIAPSDHTPASDHFLMFSALQRYDLAPFAGLGGPLDNRASACAYYRDIGAVGGCTPEGVPTGAQLTFAQWKQSWGFGSSASEAAAIYANLADLNLQRDMHMLSATRPRPGGGNGTDVASYVCNAPNPAADTTLSNARLGNNLVACVAFEYSAGADPVTHAPYNGGQPFTKFLTFGPDGHLLLSVNLDGRGEKFVPGACVACHGGSQYAGKYGIDGTPTPALNAQFLPYDLDNYRFSTLVGFRRQEQEAQLRALNLLVLATNPNTATVELINGWYPTPTSTHQGDFVPAGWQAHADLYNAVIKPDCRMCHVALDPSITFSAYSDFASYNYYIASRVCGAESIQRYKYAMPNARQTFDRFWNSVGSPPGVNAPAALLQFLLAENTLDALGNPVTSCALPGWLP